VLAQAKGWDAGDAPDGDEAASAGKKRKKKAGEEKGGKRSKPSGKASDEDEDERLQEFITAGARLAQVPDVKGVLIDYE